MLKRLFCWWGRSRRRTEMQFAQLIHLQREGNRNIMSRLDDITAEINDQTNVLAANTTAIQENTVALQGVTGAIQTEINTLIQELADARANNEAPTQEQLDRLTAQATALSNVNGSLGAVSTQLGTISTTLTGIASQPIPAR